VLLKSILFVIYFSSVKS